jgi:hypothetical protein
MRFEKVVILLSYLPVCGAAALAMAVYRKSDRALKMFCIYVLFSTVILLLSLALSQNNINNMVLLHVYCPAGFLLLAYFYKRLLNNAVNKELLPVLALLFVAFSLVNSIFFQNIFTFNTYALTTESILIIILTLFTFLVSLNRNSTSLVIRTNLHSVNWINSGLLLYHSSTLLLFYLSNYLTKFYSLNFNLNIWLLHSVVSVIMYSCFIVGLWKQLKTCP